MTILITGGAGFIGSHLIDHLLEQTDDRILVFDNLSTGSNKNLKHVQTDRVELRNGDVRNERSVEHAVNEADFIYHLAAAVGVKNVVENPLASLKTNLDGTENVLKAAAKNNTPTFIASSSEVYGKSTDVPFSEEDDRVYGPTTSARWGYATAKAADEFLALGYYKKYNLPVVVGRYFNIVGPRQTGQYGMVIPTFVEQALQNEPLTVYSDGTQTRSFTHVEDATKITAALLTTDEAHGEIYNIGAPSPTNINELADRVIELTDSDSETTHIPLSEVYGEDFEEPDEREPDVTKLEETIGWKPDTDIDRILKDVIAERKSKLSVEL